MRGASDSRSTDLKQWRTVVSGLVVEAPADGLLGVNDEAGARELEEARPGPVSNPVNEPGRRPAARSSSPIVLRTKAHSLTGGCRDAFGVLARCRRRGRSRAGRRLPGEGRTRAGVDGVRQPGPDPGLLRCT